MTDADKQPSYDELAAEVRHLRETFEATIQRLKAAERLRAESCRLLEEAEAIRLKMDSLIERISDRARNVLRRSEN